MVAKKTFRKEAREWVVAVAMVALGVFMFLALIKVLQDPKKGLASSEAAGWMQAIGSVLAIGIAIWVPYWQQEQARRQAAEAEANQVQQLLRSLLDEMLVVSANFEKRNGKLLLETPDGDGFYYIIPLIDHPFPIYEASVGRLGEIPSDALRKRVITGYGHAMGFVSSVRFNNSLIQRFEQAFYLASVNSDQAHQDFVDMHRAMLADYCKSLKNSYREAMSHMIDTRKHICLELGIELPVDHDDTSSGTVSP